MDIVSWLLFIDLFNWFIYYVFIRSFIHLCIYTRVKNKSHIKSYRDRNTVEREIPFFCWFTDFLGCSPPRTWNFSVAWWTRAGSTSGYSQNWAWADNSFAWTIDDLASDILQYIAILIGQWWLAQNRPLNSMMLGLIVAMTIHLFLVFFGLDRYWQTTKSVWEFGVCQACMFGCTLRSSAVWVCLRTQRKAAILSVFTLFPYKVVLYPVLGWSLNLINYNYRYTCQKPVN